MQHNGWKHSEQPLRPRQCQNDEIPQPSPVMSITGASRGIGAATAVLAARRGAWVTRQTQEATAKAIVATSQAAGARAVGVQCGVADESSVLAAYKRCDNELGQLSCLVNNAGVWVDMSRLEEMDADRVSTPTRTPTLACPTA